MHISVFTTLGGCYSIPLPGLCIDFFCLLLQSNGTVIIMKKTKKTAARRLIIAQIVRYLFKKKKKSNKHGPIIVPSCRRSFAIEMMKIKCDSSGFALS